MKRPLARFLVSNCLAGLVFALSASGGWAIPDITDLSARQKDQKIQLGWTDSGATTYNLYRSTTSGGPYSLIAADHVSTYSTYIDTGLTNGITYYYVVREVSPIGNELTQSNEASSSPIAGTFSLNADQLTSWAINIDGATVHTQPSLPSNVDSSAFDFDTGFGSISITVTSAGSHSVDVFFDHELDQFLNTFFNEYGSTSGTPAAGQSWEIDEPGFLFGNIDSNLLSSALDNTNSIPVGLVDDVSMAMGWDFLLTAGEFAVIDFLVSDVQPSDFHLRHMDPDSSETIFFSSRLNIGAVPEPATLLLMGLGLAGLGFGRRRRLNA